MGYKINRKEIQLMKTDYDEDRVYITSQKLDHLMVDYWHNNIRNLVLGLIGGVFGSVVLVQIILHLA